MEKVSLFTVMETSTTVLGLATRRVDLACTQTQKDQDTRAFGRRISKMAKVMKPGPKDPATRANTSKVRSRERAGMSGQTDHHTKAIG